MRLLLTICLLFAVTSVFSQEINLIPAPAKIEYQNGSFIITPKTKIIASVEHNSLLSYFNDYLLSNYGYKLMVSNNLKEKGIRLFEGNDKTLPKGGYNLTINNKGIYINGEEEGLFRGITTLLQLFPTEKKMTFSLPCCTIIDYPRFQYRGMHLDCSRHFWPVDFIKKYIDYLALHKLNTFHWHLTDDQGWRIEIKKYPKLTSVGGWRNGTIIGRYPGTGNDGLKYGGYYTQEQIKEIVKYAADRYINVIPEIEMPGHSSAAIAAYPELSCFPDEPTTNFYPKQCEWSGDKTGKQVQQTWGVFVDVFCAGQENTFKFLEEVIDEVLELFPSKYIHVGGDECPKENWKRCPKCQQRINDNKLKDEHELQSYFIQRMEKYLNNKGRTLIGWDEILEGGLAPNAVVMSWRGENGGIEAAKQNHDVIMTPGNPVYFDHSQSENEDSITIGGYNTIEKVYAYDPVPKELNEEQAKHILGAQANLWTEYIDNTKKVEYMIFPRMAALSEVLWSKKENKDYKDFEKRLAGQFKRYDLWKANYSKAYYDLKATVLPTKNFDGVLWKLEKKIKESYILINYWSKDNKINIPTPICNEGVASLDLTEAYLEKSVRLIEPLKIRNTGFYEAQIKKITTNWTIGNVMKQRFHFSKATGKKITLTTSPSGKYPGDGAFTLVNGVINEKGMAKSKEFLGFSGNDCEAIIDLIKPETISKVVVHGLRQEGSWIWQPQTAEVFAMNEKGEWQSLGLTDDFVGKPNGTMTINFEPVTTQQVKVMIKNWDEIPSGNPGAGNKAWLFISEIEVN